MDFASLQQLVEQVVQKEAPGFLDGNGKEKAFLAWGFMAKYRGECLLDPLVKDAMSPAALAVINGANQAFLAQVQELYQVRCPVCAGYGHTAGFCASLPRLRAAHGPNAQVTTWFNRALDRSDNVEAKGDYRRLSTLRYTVPDGYFGKDGRIRKAALGRHA